MLPKAEVDNAQNTQTVGMISRKESPNNELIRRTDVTTERVGRP